MDNKTLFTKYQSLLLPFVNTRFGKSYLDANFGYRIDPRDRVTSVWPNGFSLYRDIVEGGQIRKAVFYPGRPYVPKFRLALEAMEISGGITDLFKAGKQEFVVPHFLGLCSPRSYLPLVHFLDSPVTFNSLAAGDGIVENNIPSSNWAATHDDTEGNNSRPDSVSETIGCKVGSVSNYVIDRGFFPFDSSDLTSRARIQEAVFSVFMNAKVNNDNDGDDWLNVVQTSQASVTDLLTTDFPSCGAVTDPTEGAERIDIGAMTSGYVSWTLSDTGIDWIDKANENNTLLGLREGHDALNHALVNAINTGNYINVNFSDSSTSKPTLEVTHFIPGGAGLMPMM